MNKKRINEHIKQLKALTKLMEKTTKLVEGTRQALDNVSIDLEVTTTFLHDSILELKADKKKLEDKENGKKTKRRTNKHNNR